MGHISQLPSKVLVKILGLLPHFDKHRAQQVCDRWRIEICKRFGLVRTLMWPIDSHDSVTSTNSKRYPKYIFIKKPKSSTTSTTGSLMSSQSHKKLHLAGKDPYDKIFLENYYSRNGQDPETISPRLLFYNTDNNTNNEYCPSSLSEYPSNQFISPPTPPQSKNRQNLLSNPFKYQQQDNIFQNSSKVHNNQKNLLNSPQDDQASKLNDDHFPIPFTLPRKYNYSKKSLANTKPNSSTGSSESSGRNVRINRIEESFQELVEIDERRVLPDSPQSLDIEPDQVLTQSTQSLREQEPPPPPFVVQKRIQKDERHLSNTSLTHSSDNHANLLNINEQVERNPSVRNYERGQFYESTSRTFPQERHQSFYLLAQDSQESSSSPPYQYTQRQKSFASSIDESENYRPYYSDANYSNDSINSYQTRSPIRSSTSTRSYKSGSNFPNESYDPTFRYQKPMQRTQSRPKSYYDSDRKTNGESSRSKPPHSAHTTQQKIVAKNKGLVTHHLRHLRLPPGFNQADIDSYLTYDTILDDPHRHNRNHAPRLHQMKANKEDLSRFGYSSKKIIVTKRKHSRK